MKLGSLGELDKGYYGIYYFIFDKQHFCTFYLYKIISKEFKSGLIFIYFNIKTNLIEYKSIRITNIIK